MEKLTHQLGFGFLPLDLIESKIRSIKDQRGLLNMSPALEFTSSV